MPDRFRRQVGGTLLRESSKNSLTLSGDGGEVVVTGKHHGVVGKRCQLFQRMAHVAQAAAREIGAPDRTTEQSVARKQDRRAGRIAAKLRVKEQADAPLRMAGRLDDAPRHSA